MTTIISSITPKSLQSLCRVTFLSSIIVYLCADAFAFDFITLISMVGFGCAFMFLLFSVLVNILLTVFKVEKYYLIDFLLLIVFLGNMFGLVFMVTANGFKPEAVWMVRSLILLPATLSVFGGWAWALHIMGVLHVNATLKRLWLLFLGSIFIPLALALMPIAFWILTAFLSEGKVIEGVMAFWGVVVIGVFLLGYFWDFHHGAASILGSKISSVERI